jgi:hypothetical protein
MLEPGLDRLQSTQLMRSIDHFDLRSFDLNLLISFDALMEDRSVTRAAARLRVRQPAMSHSLSVLRMLLQDELFVRDGQRGRFHSEGRKRQKNLYRS